MTTPAASTVGSAATAELDPVTPVDLIGLARDARVRREQAEYDGLSVAIEWASGHEVHGPQRQEQDGAPQGFTDTGAVYGPHWADDLDLVPDELLAACERLERARRAEQPAPAPTTPDPQDLEETAERRRWRGLPELTWDCAAPLAAALGLSTRSGRVLLRQGLTLRHRLPRTHACWRTRRLETRSARTVADALAGQPDDVCAWVDQRVAARVRAHQGIGPVVAERLVQEAMAELHAEQLELERQERLQARYARLAPTAGRADGRPGPDVHGLADFVIRGEWPDVKAFHDTLALLAEAIGRSDHPAAGEALDVRRSVAVGILADPARALAMLDPDERPAPPRRKQAMLATFHLSGDTDGRPGRAPVVVDDQGTAWLDTVLREWAGRPDVDLVVRPVIHCGGCDRCDSFCADRGARTTYAPTDLDRERVWLRAPACAFPFCSVPARRCDCDHIVPFTSGDPGSGGPTCPHCNLAPLCRHHHRLKTHAGWSYRQVEPGVFAWTEPHGQSFVTTRYGTRDTTDQQRPPPSSEVSDR